MFTLRMTAVITGLALAGLLGFLGSFLAIRYLDRRVSTMGGSNDSPITVADSSSVHLRKKEGFCVLGAQHATTQMDPTKSIRFQVEGCTALNTLSGCLSGPTTLTGKSWVLMVYKMDGNLLDTLSFDITNGVVDILSTSAFSLEDPDGDGVGLFHPDPRLGKATLAINGGNPLNQSCPTSPPGGKCKMRVIYCQQDDCSK